MREGVIEGVVDDVTIKVGETVGDEIILLVAVTTGEFVAVKKSVAKAAWVSILSSGVAVVVYAGVIMMSACFSVFPPANIYGMTKPTIQVAMMTSGIKKPSTLDLIVFLLFRHLRRRL